MSPACVSSRVAVMMSSVARMPGSHIWLETDCRLPASTHLQLHQQLAGSAESQLYTGSLYHAGMA